ncbi:hypothetical protein TREMEDRAFT_45829 [Tremella mesenterica DSM 1558]|uniref:uncharacterized protein n=1 Tax=Tremella mesenterica (strain ATCC 24925 / CBS 8224 / DSM 1558 / NBRC 9311 / NRRL Y-6157 / RJB 2259-6 / UBC 559-6) TaxID=578456 RepID=UPI00032BDE8C|nr:uncharacterized protein TREMEDRAFT_45829 [Tremella mesenterica DSM 1558]EIW66403.1 hypothetical protein TREMEDRAFT_45829 [Tremella mesenterica DSM 1558]
MTAIIITQAAPPDERTHLLVSSSPPSLDSQTAIRPDQPANLHRLAPLRESISTFRFVLTCIGIWSANFVFAFQASAIPTLAPSIGSGFKQAEFSTYLGSAFTLCNTGVIPVYGILMETLGRRFAMLTACAFFGLGTIFCALSPSMGILIAARAFAGLGGGGLLTVSSVIVTDLVPLRERGVFQGIMMSIFGAGTMLGGPCAGWLADRFGWPFAFWVQLPVVLFCATVVASVAPEAPLPPTHQTVFSGLKSIDWLGTFTLLGSVSSLLLGFSFHTSFLDPWSSPRVWGTLLFSIVLGCLFVWVEHQVERPVIPIEVLKTGHVKAVMLGGFFLSISYQAYLFQIPAYFAVILDTSTAEAGVILSVCGGLGLASGSLIAGQYIRHGGAYKWLGVISLIPGITSTLIAASWKPDWPWWAYYATVLPGSLGYSVFLSVTLVALIASCDSKLMPKATALLYMIRSLGVTLGVSTGGSIQLGALTSALKSRLSSLPIEESNEIINSVLHSKASIRQLSPPYDQLALDAYASSLSTVFLFSFVVSLCTWSTSFFIKDIELHGHGGKRVGSGDEEEE